MRAAIVLVALLLGCGADHGVDHAPVPVALTREERAAIAVEEAATLWADAIGYAPAVDHVRFEEPDSDEDRVAGAFDAETAALILVPTRLGEDQSRWAAVVAHEMGHGLGLWHVDDARALMAATVSEAHCLHAADVLEIRRVLGVVVSSTCH